MNLSDAIVVTQQGVEVIKADQLITRMAERGFPIHGQVKSTRLRSELQGAPTFKGIRGPMYGGPETPLRYEDDYSFDRLSC